MTRSAITGLSALVALLGLASPVASAPIGPVASTFDLDLDGWEAWGFDIDTLSVVRNAADERHAAVGGNPGGFAEFLDVTVEPASALRAPEKFHGDWSDFLGTGSFRYDHRLFSVGTTDQDDPDPVKDYFVFVFSGPVTILGLNVAIFQAPGPAAATDWVTIEAPLDPLQWTVVSPFVGGTFESILGNVTDVVVTFEIVNNDVQQEESVGVDNAMLVPEPATLGLLAVGGLVLLRRKR